MAERAASAPTEDAALHTSLEAGEDLDFKLIELFFFAYRDFTADADQLLARDNFGRAHHRVLHFVNRMPGLTVAELLDVLKITKQSLARVLKQLIDTGHIVQLHGPRDRRQRRLHPTDKGRDLMLTLARPQSRRIRAALESAGAGARKEVEAFLTSMIDADWRSRLDTKPDEGENRVARVGETEAR